MGKMKIDPTTSSEEIVELVKDRYGAIAQGVGASCCAPSTASCCGDGAPSGLGYAAAELNLIPDGADLGLGCGAPLEHLELERGETVLDLGSGAGIDVFLAARQVGPEGMAIGVDMTPEMLEKARANAARGGFDNVEFRSGRLEELPIADHTVDAITSNCVINLVPDKKRVFAEAVRVLKPGGRMVVSDIVLDGELPEAVSSDLLAYAGCVAGALRRETYFGMLAAAGFEQVEIVKDVDFLALVPADELAKLSQVVDGAVRREELVGIVRSVTYRALVGES